MAERRQHRRVLDMNPYASLPTIHYGDNPTPEQFHRAVAEASGAGPVALGPFCPEVLSYDLVRSVLRDPRFVTPQGIALVLQNITAGPVWDRVTRLLLNLDGTEHRRLRALVAKAFSPRAAERMRSACTDVITELVDRCAAAGRCDFVADIARPYPIPIICSLLGAPRQDWEQLSEWVVGVGKAMSIEVAQTRARSCAPGTAWRTTSNSSSPYGAESRPMTCSPSCCGPKRTATG